MYGSHLHPAEELHLLREDMRRIRMREAELRRQFITGPARLRDGPHHRVEVTAQTRRVFDRAALPPEILHDQRFWRLEESPVLRVVPRELWPDGFSDPETRGSGPQGFDREDSDEDVILIDDTDR